MARVTVNEYSNGYSDEIILTALDFNNTTAAAETITVPVNAGDVVRGAAIQTVTAFSGGSLSAVSITVGDGDDADGYLAAYDAFSGGDSTAANSGDLLDGTTSYFKVYSSDDTIDITVTPTGDGMADAEAGEVRILLDIARL